MSTENNAADSANDVGGEGESLRPSEALDSDEVRNNDGDDVVDPPERWIEPKEDETLDERLSDEVPDVAADGEAVAGDITDGGDVVSVSDDELDHLDTQRHGTDEGQVSGTPEDGESFFDVVE
ncbi:hypothetical protein O6P37_21255 [Mycobacterium sp. CPCC 205372]|uniref:PAS domain S-box/diguanylate cyclase (GGDEF) domain-containing protein n=1 Tax=Mycobacterium hippophais TaxID=3016340 RepID=A0ABT4PY15_9MYCO|nr:hypothetical protein [Mycobacterium hippophais]MCZ8381403.1 hypothetical protein [Mycobacterium hippophais]